MNGFAASNTRSALASCHRTVAAAVILFVSRGNPFPLLPRHAVNLCAMYKHILADE